ncbi:hypothetical protein AYI70_g3232 [Smittium culicis]|uniref:Uncharacterized protein n=1 Tax=Smittium culicis TaxID=133412 RepID=A0A1R1Y4E0_9FUNG|nr:hypothetical protein AYI70_g3232 [Smittium culicis]
MCFKLFDFYQASVKRDCNSVHANPPSPQKKVTSTGCDSLIVIEIAQIPIKFDENTMYLNFKFLDKCAV